MKHFALILSFVILSYSCREQVDATKEFIQVGVSKAVMNPPIGSYIAGDKQNRKFTGILDSLYIKAVVAFDGETAIAIVTLDCIGLLYNDIQKVREKVSSHKFNIPFSPENIIISSTHTHSGPDVVGLWGKDYSESGVDPEYMDFLITTTARVINEASQSLQNATIEYAITEFGHEWVANICDDEIDRTVTTLQFLDNKGKNIVSLTNFACHPTYLDAVISQISADFVAGFYSKMEKELGGEHLFLQGAIGGWVQPIDKNGEYKHAIKRGEELADITLEALITTQPLESFRISYKNKRIFFPVENEGWRQLAANGIFKRDITDVLESEIAWFSIGEATFATHPGETAPIFGLQTKEMMPEGPKFVLGLGQDALGYILKPSYFENNEIPHANYLTRMSLGKKAGPLLIEELEKLANKE